MTENYRIGGVMVSKLDLQTYTSEFESHWAPLSYGLVPHLSKKSLVNYLCRRVRPRTNDCPGYDIKHSDGEVLVMLGALGNAEYLFVAIALWSTLTRSGSSWNDPIYGSNRIVWQFNWVQTNDLCLIELFEIELFDHLAVCRQLTNV